MNKQDYTEQLNTLETKVEELELKLEQQTQDYHFDMRNKQMEIIMLNNKNESTYIYESPDNGDTIYRRKFGQTNRELIKSSDDNPNQLNLFNDYDNKH